MTQPTKQRLIEAGLAMLLEHGYGSLGVQALLDATGVPKGSFYHHFKDKEDFALTVIDTYIGEVHKVLDMCLGDDEPAAARPHPPLLRDWCSRNTARRLHGLPDGRPRPGAFRHQRGLPPQDRMVLLVDRRAHGGLPRRRRSHAATFRPSVDAERMGHLLVDCWEGAALRSRLRRDPQSLMSMVDFYLAIDPGRRLNARLTTPFRRSRRCANPMASGRVAMR